MAEPRRFRAMRLATATLVAAFTAPLGDAALPSPAPAAVDLLGEWVLVRQTYAGGEANLADPEVPLKLRLTREGAGMEVRVLAGGSPAQRWPAFVAATGPLALEMMERSVEPAKGLVRSRYRVQPAPEDDLILEIVEEYHLSPDGRALEGTLSVRFLGGQANRGGYLLHRRFERAP